MAFKSIFFIMKFLKEIKLLLLNFILVFFSIGFPILVYPQQPENVFIVIIDGLRNDEGFEAESLYLRHIWNDLRPQGTIYRRFWNRGWTATTAGHNTIACGVRQIVRNNSGTQQDIRPDQPTFFEYFRKTFGLPESTAGALMGKGNCRCVDFSLDPSYGENYKGFLRYNAADTTVSNWVHRTMDSLHPRLLYINLREVDGAGHSGNYDAYIAAIRTADSIVYEFWKHIQAIPPYTDTFYKNKTVMIVTTDHGRHDDAHGGFSAHGKWDHGCRDLMFLAIGPGIKQNTVINDIDRDHIDIVPTIGYILGFPTPLAEGDVMTEIFSPEFSPNKPKFFPVVSPFSHEWNLSNNSGFSREPELTITKNGTLHLVWMDKTNGKWEVYYRKSTDQGRTWTPTRILFDFPNKDSVMWFAKIAGDDSLIVSAMGYAKVGQFIDSLPPYRIDTTFIWYPWIATSVDDGNSWHITSLPDSNMGSYAAPVAVKNGRYSIAYWLCGKFNYERTKEGLNFNWRNAGGNWQTLDSTRRVINKKFHSISLIDDGNYFHIAGCCLQAGDEDWEIGYWRSRTGDSWTTVWITRDTGSDVYFDYDPALIKDSFGNLHLVWARKPDVGGTWQIQYTKSTDNGITWSNFRQITFSPAGAWKPKIAVRHETLFVFFEDYRDGEPKIYYTMSPDLGTTWSIEEPIAGAIARNPSVAIDSNKIYIAWQDYRDGNWEIYFKYLPFSSPRHDVGPFRLINPPSRCLPEDSIIPQAMISNYGDVFETFKVYLTIQPSYFDSAIVTVAPEDSLIVTFSTIWQAAFGTYPFKLWTTLRNDENQTNDTIIGTIEVVGDSWVQLKNIPLGSRSKKVKGGGYLTYCADQNLIYALKGNNTNEFYAYDLNTSEWLTKESIPYYPNGRAKRVKSGAALCYDGNRYIYVTKGNNTTEFWRYDTKADSLDTVWKPLPSVPELPSGKKLKGGTGLAFVTKGSDHYIYLLKGSKTTDFYAYHIEGDSWILTLPQAPQGPNHKGFLIGSGMVKVGNALYALKAYFNELYRYDLAADTWQKNPISIMPFVGRSNRKKKVKDGASLCSDGVNYIFAFKGGNTTEFWQYLINEDTWIQNADLPFGPDNKRVKSGGALIFAKGRVYALKGNNTLEFWQYTPKPIISLKTKIEKNGSLKAAEDALGALSLIISYNPARKIIRIKYLSTNTANSHWKIFDATGALRWQTRISNQQNVLEIPITNFASGVYFLKVENPAFVLSQKFIIRR